MELLKDEGFGAWVTAQALRNGNRIAFVDGLRGRETTYSQLEERTNRLADALAAKGIRRGDRIAMLTANSPQMMEVYFAAAKLGAIGVPINARLAPPEVAYVLNDSGAAYLFVSSALAPVADAALAEAPGVRHRTTIPMLAERAGGDEGEYGELLASGSPERVERSVGENDVCVLMYTSGTTGKPKGAMLTHRNFFYNACNAFGFGSGIGREDITVSAAPLFHIGALGVHTLPFAYIGASTVIMESFNPTEWLDVVEQHRVTMAFLVPAMWAAVLQAMDGTQRDLDSLVFAVTGGAPCPLPVIKGLQQRGVNFTEGFGMTETSPSAACLHPEDVITRAGSIGRPVNHLDFTILDDEDREVPVGTVGELCVRGPSVFVGYWNKPAESAQAIRGGWFHTGDLAKVDEDGYYTLVDRKKDMIITGGENVYPIEVEQVMYGHPEVNEVAVYGLPDGQWGERVVASVALVEGASITEDGLIEWTRERIAHFKTPKQIEIVEALPRNATGKILKRELRKTHTGREEAVTR